MQKSNLNKLTFTAILASIATIGSIFSFPLFGAKCAPIQHMVNILCAILLGPEYGVTAAILSSTIRNILGIGTPLAFPGSIFGAFLSGILYQKTKKLFAAFTGEVIGTSLLGGLAAYPIAYFIMGNHQAALFTFIIPFLISTCGGTTLAIILTLSMAQTGILKKMQL